MRYALPLSLAMLGATVAGQSAIAEPRFEVFSIKPSPAELLPPNLDPEEPCSSAVLQASGRRLTGVTTLYALVAATFNPWRQAPRACDFADNSDLIVMPERWMREERFAVQALYPEGREAAAYERLLSTGAEPDTQQMLRAALADRFGLSVRSETREMPVYFLEAEAPVADVRARMARSMTAAFVSEGRRQPGIFTASREQDGLRFTSVMFVNQPLDKVAGRLAITAQRPVRARIDLTGNVDLVLEFDDTGVVRPTFFTALREQLGLRLVVGRAALDVLIVERAQRPTED